MLSKFSFEKTVIQMIPMPKEAMIKEVKRRCDYIARLSEGFEDKEDLVKLMDKLGKVMDFAMIK